VLGGNLAPFEKAPKLLIDVLNPERSLVSWGYFATVTLTISHLTGFSMLPAYSFVCDHAWVSFSRLIG
jgi:hypothetical protein